MAVLITAIIVGLAVVLLFGFIIIIAVPWAADRSKEEGYRLLADVSPDLEALKDTIEELAASEDEEAKELAAHLTVKLLEETRAAQDDQVGA